MALTNGGFETGTLSGWSGFSGGITVIPGAAFFGTYGCRTESPGGRSTRQQSLASQPAGLYKLTYYAIAGSSGYSGTSLVTLSTPNESVRHVLSPVTLTVERPSGSTESSQGIDLTEWRKLTMQLEVTQTSALTLAYSSSETAGEVWLFDQFTLGEGVFTETIHAAIVSDLGDIDGTGTFSTTIAEAAGDDNKRFDEMNHPAAIVTSGSGNDQNVTQGNKRSEATQNYIIRLSVQSEAPQTAMRALLDDVRDALQRSDSNVLAASTANHRVERVSCEWDTPDTDQVTHEGVITATVTVAVEYLFTPGVL